MPEPVTEWQFAKAIGRKWRFDLAYPDRMLAIEVDGGVWTSGRHTRGSGFVKDLEKFNQAAIDGWKVLRYAGVHIDSGWAVAEIERVLKP